VRVVFFSTRRYEQDIFERLSAYSSHDIHYLEPRLNVHTAGLACGSEAVCAFVNDELPEAVLEILAAGGTKLIALRCAGFNRVALTAAERLGIVVARVPAYSPEAVAEHAVALMLTLNRKTHKAYLRVREANLSLDGLLGFEMRGRTVGIIGAGRIGQAAARILHGFGCRLLAYDVAVNQDELSVPVSFLPLDRVLAESQILTLHCPLTPQTHRLINAETIERMKRGVMLINTSRGGLIDTQAVIGGLKSGKIGYLGLDVYEEEGDLFFRDLSGQILQDDVFARLLTFSNVLITGHQGFFTDNALEHIARTTLDNITEFEQTGRCTNAATTALTR
jgi:D-lactate dehydrogenase